MQLKFFPLSPLILALGLTGCQLTDNNNDNAQLESNETASLEACSEIHNNEEAISDCEIARDGVIDVVHPNDDTLEEGAELTDTPDMHTQAVVTDVWERASANFALPIPDDKRISAQRNWYLKHPEYMARVVKRAKPFLYYIAEEIEKLTPYISVRVLGVYGGTNINTQKRAISEGLDIIVGTPRRLYDLALTNVLQLKSIKTC